MWHAFPLVLSLVVLLTSVESRKSGAPESACTNFAPNHQNDARAGDGGFTLSLQGDNGFYSPGADFGGGGTATVRLGGGVFQGFLVIAYAEATGAYVGSMRWSSLNPMATIPASRMQAACSSHGMTHTNTNFKQPMFFQWKPPTSNVGRIKFKAVVVTDFYTWYHVGSVEFLDPQPTPPSPPRQFIVSTVLDTLVTLDWLPPITTGTSALSHYRVSLKSTELSVLPDTNTTLLVNTTVFINTTDNFLRIDSLINDTYYTVAVQAANLQGLHSLFSNALTLHTLALDDFPPLPDTVTRLNTTAVGITFLNVSWPEPELYGQSLILYNLQVKVEGGGFVDVYFGPQPQFSLTNLRAATNFTVRVCARSLVGTGNFSEEFTFRTLPWPPCPGNCTNEAHGLCTKGQCRCKPGFVGSRCNTTGIVFCTTDGYWCAYFGVENDTMHVQWIVKGVNGWVGIMIGAPDGMSGGDAWVGEYDSAFVPPSTQIAAFKPGLPVQGVIPDPHDTTRRGFRTQALDGTVGWIPRDFGHESDAQFFLQNLFGTPNQNLSDVYNTDAGVDTQSGNVRLLDEFSLDFRAPQLDPIQNLDVLVGYQLNNQTFYQFSRKLRTNDRQRDNAISPSGYNFVSWAHGAPGFAKHELSARGRLLIDFATGDVRVVGDTTTTQYLAPLIVILVVMALGVVANCCCRTPGSASGCCFHANPCRCCSPRRHSLDKWTLDVRLALADLSYGEWFVVVSFWVAFAAFVAVAKMNNDDAYRSDAFVYGHITAILYAVVLLPPTKNSIFLYIFGIPFERALKYHRWLARFAVAMSLVHLLTMLSYRGSYIVSDTSATPRGYGSVYGFLAFLCFATVFAMAWEPIRRHAFELFRFTHYLAIPGVVLAMLHSRDYFYAGIVPMALYMIDFNIRFMRRWCRQAKSVTARVIPTGETRLTKVEVEMDGFSYNAGDYAFVNFPQVSAIQWHPFSISSAPSRKSYGSAVPSSRFTFHILDMGQGTFTGALAEKASSGKGLTAARIDGPYGRLTLPVHKYKRIFLAAGGVGVTPLMSVLDDLYHSIDGLESDPDVQAVTLVWVSKHRQAFLEWFPEELKRISSNSRLSIKLFLRDSRGKQAAGTELDEMHQGIPPILTENFTFATLLKEFMKGGDAASTAVLACGPERMVADVQMAAAEQGAHFHKETFVL